MSRLGSCGRVRLPAWVAGLGAREPSDLLRVLLRVLLQVLLRGQLRGLLRLVRARGAGNGGVEEFLDFFNWWARCLPCYFSSWQSSYKSRLQVFSATSLAVSTNFYEEASLVLGVHFQQEDLISLKQEQEFIFLLIWKYTQPQDLT